MKKDKLLPIHPGEVLLHDFLEPFNITSDKLAAAIHVTVELINDIINKKKSITADLALRFARYFNNSPQFWMGIQMDYDLDVAEEKIENFLKEEIQPMVSS